MNDNVTLPMTGFVELRVLYWTAWEEGRLLADPGAWLALVSAAASRRPGLVDKKG